MNENEVLKLQRESGLFKNNLFKLQLDELLKELKQRDKYVILNIECSGESDYHIQKAHFLAGLLKKNEIEGVSLSKFKIEFRSNDLKSPMLTYKKKNKQIKVYLTCELKDLTLKNLEPGKSLAKVGLSQQMFSILNGDTFMNIDQQKIKSATPQHNNSILYDALVDFHLQYIANCLSECPNLKEAIELLKLWATKRKLNERLGYCLDDILISMLVCWLYKCKSNGVKISKNFSSYQIFKLAMVFLSKQDWDQILFLTEDMKPAVKGFDIENFKNRFDVCIISPSGLCNLAGNMTKSCINEIHHEATITSDLLNNENDNFHSIFLQNIDLYLKYDNIIHIPIIKRDLATYTLADEVNFSSFAEFVIRKILKIVTEGLGDRAKLISVFSPPYPSFHAGEMIDVADNCQNIYIGLILNSEEALKQVHIGPDAQDTSAVEAFRNLWGPKSETRRFKDGSIKEAVVFNCPEALNHKSVIVARMVAFLLDRHFDVNESTGVSYWAGLGTKYLKPWDWDNSADFSDISNCYIKTTKALRALDLPLSINSFHPVSDTLTKSSVFVPVQYKKTKESIIQPKQYGEFMIEFESSGKWPDDIAAIETMKRAFYIKICNLLKESQSQADIVGQVCLDEKNQSFIELNSFGFLFKVWICQPRVGHLIEQQLKVATHDKVALLNLKSAYDSEFLFQPRHCHMINNIAIRFTHFGTTCRIAKRWLSSHLLMHESCIPYQILELLCAKVYTNPAPYQVPNSGFTGFLRMLELVSTHRWEEEAVIVELEADSIDEALALKITEGFEVRKGGLYVATEYDIHANYFNQRHIDPKIVELFIILSSQSLNFVRTLFDQGESDITVTLILNLEYFYSEYVTI
jgi:U3 small nucleolar RNA-associated protein 22